MSELIPKRCIDIENLPTDILKEIFADTSHAMYQYAAFVYLCGHAGAKAESDKITKALGTIFNSHNAFKKAIIEQREALRVHPHIEKPVHAAVYSLSKKLAWDGYNIEIR